jgi:hypothetical protein
VSGDISPPPSFVFLVCGIVAVLLGGGLYHSYRRGAISYSRWYGRDGPYRRDTQRFLFWFCMAMSGFAFVVLTLGALLMLYITIMTHLS